MLKINKCVALARTFPVVLNGRYMGCCCGANNGKGGCPPKYECKQPAPDNDRDADLEELKAMDIPTIFTPDCSNKSKKWKKIFYFLCVPAILCLFVNIFFTGEEKIRRPKFIPFEYLRIRRNGYPWDPVRTLFHNPKLNALPDGYEVEVDEEEEYDPFEPDK